MLAGFGDVDFEALSIVFHFLCVPCEMPGPVSGDERRGGQVGRWYVCGCRLCAPSSKQISCLIFIIRCPELEEEPLN